MFIYKAGCARIRLKSGINSSAYTYTIGMMLKNTHIKASLFLFTIFVIIISFILFCISYLPFEIVKSNLNTFASDGSAESFTPEYFDKIKIRLQFIGIVMLIASGLFYTNIRRIQKYVSNIILFFIKRGCAVF